LITNYEKVKGIRWDFDVEWDALILDEAHAIGKYPKPNQCVAAIRGVKCGIRIGVSATPCAESYSQLFHQERALGLGLWNYKNFYDWFRAYGISEMIRVNGRWVETYKRVKEKAWEEFSGVCAVVDRQEVMKDFVEAKDVVVELKDSKVSSMCEELKREGILTVGDRTVVADTPMAVAQKCQQVCNGRVKDDLGEFIRVGSTKLDWYERFKGVKTAFLTQYRYEATDISERYVGVEITDDFERFSGDGFMGWFVGTWHRFARGVDLSAAEALVITSCPWSAEGLEQGRDRLLNQARKEGAPVYFPVIAGEIDARIYNVVAGEKRNFTARQYARATNPGADH
jgi:hypothetical protein